MIALSQALSVAESDRSALSLYSDADRVSDDAVSYVAGLISSGIVNGITPTLIARRNPSPVPNCLRCSTEPLSRSSHHPELMSLLLKTDHTDFVRRCDRIRAKHRQRSSLQAVQTAE